MKLSIVALLALVGCASAFWFESRDKREADPMLVGAIKVDNKPVTIGATLVSAIANRTKLFTAKRYNQFEGLSTEELNHFLGVQRDPEVEAALVSRTKREIEEGGEENEEETVDGEEPVAAQAVGASPPATFDSSTKWPKCKAVFEQIQDQSNCGSCWAVSTASVITDRRCIVYAGVSKPRISAWDLVGCCTACKANANGCEGGYTYGVMEYYVGTGVVTGGAYKAGGCKPYAVAPGAPNQPTTTACSRTCQTAYKAATYAKDKKRGGTARYIQLNNTLVMNEIAARGPVVAQFAVYQDFYQYSSGVYIHTTGQLVGYHAVKIVGWGKTSTGVPFWKVANSWGKNWGENGFFRIRRGTNECGFEEFIVSATARKD